MHQRGATPINPLDGAVSCPTPAPPGRAVPQGRGGWGGVCGKAHGNHHPPPPPLPTMGTKSIPSVLLHHQPPFSINGSLFICLCKWPKLIGVRVIPNSHIRGCISSYLNWGDYGRFDNLYILLTIWNKYSDSLLKDVLYGIPALKCNNNYTFVILIF